MFFSWERSLARLAPGFMLLLWWNWCFCEEDWLSSLCWIRFFSCISYQTQVFARMDLKHIRILMDVWYSPRKSVLCSFKFPSAECFYSHIVECQVHLTVGSWSRFRVQGYCSCVHVNRVVAAVCVQIWIVGDSIVLSEIQYLLFVFDMFVVV